MEQVQVSGDVDDGVEDLSYQGYAWRVRLAGDTRWEERDRGGFTFGAPVTVDGEDEDAYCR